MGDVGLSSKLMGDVGLGSFGLFLINSFSQYWKKCICVGNFKSLKNIKKFEVFRCLYQRNRQKVRGVGLYIQMMGDVGLNV